jgi:hypothetical protein
MQANSFYIAVARTTHKTELYFCLVQTTQKTSHVIAKYCWSVTSLRLAEVCLPSRCLGEGCIIPLFHCWCVYYLETAVSVAQPFLHGANTLQYLQKANFIVGMVTTAGRRSGNVVEIVQF